MNHLEPLPFSQLLPKTFSLMRDSWKESKSLILLTWLIVSAMMSVLLLGFAEAPLLSRDFWTIMNAEFAEAYLENAPTFVTVLFGILSFLGMLWYFVLVAMFVAVADRKYRGEDISFDAAWQHVRKRLGSYAGFTILLGLLYAAVALVFTLIFAMSNSMPSQSGEGFSMLMMTAVSFIALLLLAQWIFGGICVLVEGASATEAFRHSSRMFKTRYLRTLWRIAFLHVVGSLITFIPNVLATYLLTYEAVVSSGWILALLLAVVYFAAIFTQYYTANSLIVLYYDVRALRGEFEPGYEGIEAELNPARETQADTGAELST
ncbi:MAG: hypothetical protein CL946_01855 [Ectothiorhodospiraceae bacterium]|nr:hypothetical protein [Ectothiorhodospiraceae bacterium]